MMGLQLDMVLNHGHMVFGKVNPARLAALDRIELLYFAVVLLAAIGVLAWRLRRGAAWEQHRQMQWMAWGVVGGYVGGYGFMGGYGYGDDNGYGDWYGISPGHDECPLFRQRVMTPEGWRIQMVPVC